MYDRQCQATLKALITTYKAIPPDYSRSKTSMFLVRFGESDEYRLLFDLRTPFVQKICSPSPTGNAKQPYRSRSRSSLFLPDCNIDPRTRNRIVAMQLLSLGFPRITTAALHSKLEVTLLELSQQAPDCKVGNLYALHTLYDRVTF